MGISVSRLEYAVEELVIQLHQRDSRLTGFKFSHKDEDNSADVECVVVKAVRGERNEAGFKGYRVDVTSTLRTNRPMKAMRRGLIMDALADSVHSATPSCVDAMKLFTDLTMEPESSGERSNETNLRKNSRMFSFYAKAKS